MKMTKMWFLLLAVSVGRSADTNHVWIVGPHSGSYTIDAKVDYNTIPAENAREDLPNMILSHEIFSLKSGVWINNSNHVIVVKDHKMTSEATLVMLNTSTNDLHFWWSWPSTELQYSIKLVDKTGHEVQKTSYGKNFGWPAEWNADNARTAEANKDGLRMMAIPAMGDILYRFHHYDPIKLLPECFNVENPGVYKLFLTHHIYISESRTNGLYLKSACFSTIAVDVRFE